MFAPVFIPSGGGSVHRPKPKIPVDAPPGPTRRVYAQNFSFAIPSGWARVPSSSRVIFRDVSQRHTVELAWYISALQPAQWATAYYAGTTAAPTMLGDRPAVVVRADRTTSVIVSTGGDLFELRCTQDDTSKLVPNVICSRVLGSLRV